MKGKFGQPSKSPKKYDNDFIQNFLLLLMPLLKAPSAKNCHILAGTYFIYLKKRPKSSLKNLQYQIWISVKRAEKHLSRNMGRFNN